MASKLLFQLCLSVFVVKAVLSHCIPSLGPQKLHVSAPFAANRNHPMVLPSAPIEVTISSDNLIIDGCIDVIGRLPFCGGVVVEGVVPNCGDASVVYECGNGNVGIELPTSGFPGTGTGMGYNPGLEFNNGGQCGYF